MKHVHPHQLRHTYATTLVNGGMSLEALMAVLGHVTPEMTLRYAHLASDTIADAYTTAIAKTAARTRLVAGPGGHFVPNRVEWLHSEMIKTRVAHGYCSRHLTAGACAYANICEQCDNYTTAPEFAPAINAQINDIKQLETDANNRGWDTETTRHHTVVDHLERHLQTIKMKLPKKPLDSTPEGRLIGFGYTNEANYTLKICYRCCQLPSTPNPAKQRPAALTA